VDINLKPIMSIAVTGGAGFIGSHVCEALLGKGLDVVCIDNFNDYYNPKFKEENISECLKNKNFKLHRKDITNINDLRTVFKKNKIEKVIHLAARAGVRPSIEQPVLYEQANVLGTLNMLMMAKDFKAENFVFGSSSSIYGNTKEIPFSESSKTDSPVSPYAATKKSAELMCHAYSHMYNIPMTCLRLFTAYGPRGRPDMAPYKFTELIYNNKELEMFGDGKTKRDYTYVKDIVDGILAAVGKEFKFEVINLGNSKPVELRQFISIIEENLGKKAKIKKMPLQPGEVDVTYADVKKAERLLTWKPKTDIKNGMKKFIEWYKNERA